MTVSKEALNHYRRIAQDVATERVEDPAVRMDVMRKAVALKQTGVDPDQATMVLGHVLMAMRGYVEVSRDPQLQFDLAAAHVHELFHEFVNMLDS